MSSVRSVEGVLDGAVEAVATGLRELERIDFLRQFPTVEEAIRASIQASEEVWTGLVDGAPSAIWGVSHPVWVGVGVPIRAPWLALTARATENPIATLRHARDMAERLRGQYPVLHNWVPVEDEPARALLRFVGFRVLDDSEPYEGANGGLYFPFTMVRT